MSMFRPAPLFAAMQLALLGTLPAAAVAAEDSQKPIEVIVVTASGFEQKLVDAPASISVINGIDLQTKPYVTLLDAVRELEGVDVGETRDKTGQGTVSMRGMGSDYTLILIDGRRQNNNGDIYPNNFGGNQFNHIPPMSAVERIEVIRGPASTLYGADALGGVINIITKKNIQSTQLALSHSRTLQTDSVWGDDITSDFSLLTPLLQDKLSMALRGAHYKRQASNPEYAPATDPNGVVQSRELGFGGGGKTVDNNNWSAGASLHFTPDARQTLSLIYDVSKQQYDNEGNQLGTEDTYDAMLRNVNGQMQPRAGYARDQRFSRQQLALQHIGDWQSWRSDVGLSYIETANLSRTLPFTVQERGLLQDFWNQACLAAGGRNNSAKNCIPAWLAGRNDAARSSAFTALPEAQKLAFMQQHLSAAQYQQLLNLLPRDSRVMQSSQYTLDAKAEIPLDQHRLVLGGQWINGEMEDGVFGMFGDGYAEGTVQNHDMWSLFGEDNWDITNAVTLTAGVRYDDHNVFGGQVSPRLYSVWTLSPAWTLKGGVSTGYKTPKTSDLYPGITMFGGQGVSPGVGNPELQPETSINTEIALYYSHDDGHQLNLTLFRNEFEDKISSGGDAIPPCDRATAGQRCADVGAGWADLGYISFTQKVNIDRVDIQGAELAGEYQLPYGLRLKGNYTLTDSEQKSGSSQGQPMTNTARHMANLTLDWQVIDPLRLSLVGEIRSKRYRGFDAVLNKQLYYKDYEVLHLGASYQLSDNIRLNARINNLLDQDFTSYQTSFVPVEGGGYTGSYVDDFNNKDKARNFWLGLNVEF